MKNRVRALVLGVPLSVAACAVPAPTIELEMQAGLTDVENAVKLLPATDTTDAIMLVDTGLSAILSSVMTTAGTPEQSAIAGAITGLQQLEGDLPSVKPEADAAIADLQAVSAVSTADVREQAFTAAAAVALSAAELTAPATASHVAKLSPIQILVDDGQQHIANVNDLRKGGTATR